MTESCPMQTSGWICGRKAGQEAQGQHDRETDEQRAPILTRRVGVWDRMIAAAIQSSEPIAYSRGDAAAWCKRRVTRLLPVPPSDEPGWCREQARMASSAG